MLPKNQSAKYYRNWMMVYLIMCTFSGGGLLKGLYLIATHDASDDLKARTSTIFALFVIAAWWAIDAYKKMKYTENNKHR